VTTAQGQRQLSKGRCEQTKLAEARVMQVEILNLKFQILNLRWGAY
jgi:hypothetical protein